MLQRFVGVFSEKVSALHMAAGRGFAGVVRALLAHRAKTDALDCKDQTPLFLAVSRAHLPVAALLLAAGADPNVRQLNGLLRRNCLSRLARLRLLMPNM